MVDVWTVSEELSEEADEHAENGICSPSESSSSAINIKGFFSILLIAVSVISLFPISLVFFGIANNWHDLDETLATITSTRVPWSFIITLLVILAVIVIGSNLGIVILRRKVLLYASQVAILSFITVACLIGVCVICVAGKGLVASAILLIVYYSPFLFPTVCGVLFIVSVFLLVHKPFHEKVRKITRFSSAQFNFAVVTVFNGVMIITLTISIVSGFYNPCITSKNLPQKPKLIAHRGVQEEAPENTLVGFQRSLDYDFYGFESDIFISKDSIPFAMHDDNLIRTTNVKDVFPERKHENPSEFTWEELQKLRANNWRGDSLFKRTWKRKFPNATVPAYKDLVRISQEHERIFLFDMKFPVSREAFKVYQDVLFKETLSAITRNASYQWWLFDPNRERDTATIEEKRRAGLTLACNVEMRDKNSVERLKSLCQVINQEIGIIAMPRKCSSYIDNFHLNVYTVNSPWLFSFCWCRGVHSVTTDNGPTLLKKASPDYFINSAAYYVPLCVCYVLMTVLVTGLFVWKVKKRANVTICI